MHTYTQYLVIFFDDSDGSCLDLLVYNKHRSNIYAELDPENVCVSLRLWKQRLWRAAHLKSAQKLYSL